jgi:putative glutamine amidotransferase
VSGELIAVTQRVTVIREYGERRDMLDQRWSSFLAECGWLAVPVPNVPAVAMGLFDRLPISGLLLTGGNDLCDVGGDAPERDATERALLSHARELRVPVVGVCRGMQVIQNYWKVPLERVHGHVTADHVISMDARRDHVNSYHNYGAMLTVPELDVWALADDGVVEAVRHRSEPVLGVMWHPERFPSARPADVELFREAFCARRQR